MPRLAGQQVTRPGERIVDIPAPPGSGGIMQPESDTMSEPHLDVAVSMLHNFDLRPTDAAVSQRPVNLILRRIDNPRGSADFIILASAVCWWLNDNGGEWNMQRVNVDDLPTSIPTSWHGFPLNEATMAMRLAMVLRGEPIDYDERMTDDDQATLMAHRKAV